MVRSRLFCCCLPVRFGVFSMSILYFALGGLIAASGFLQLKDQDAFKALVPRDKTALILNTVMYSLLALVSILGFIGAIAKSRNCIAVYRTVLSLHLGFSIATGVFYIITLFNKDNENNTINLCVQRAINDVGVDTTAVCRSSYQIFRGVVIGVLVLIWLIELWGCIICADYVDQLEDEQAMQSYKTSAPSMTTTYNVNHFGAQPQGVYPFSQPGVAQTHSAPYNV